MVGAFRIGPKKPKSGCTAHKEFKKGNIAKFWFLLMIALKYVKITVWGPDDIWSSKLLVT